MKNTTESESIYDGLDKKPISELLKIINSEDITVPLAVGNSLGSIEALIRRLSVKMLAGGRLFYIGTGTSGRIGVLDASECPPTFGVPYDLIIGLIIQAISNGTEIIVVIKKSYIRHVLKVRNILYSPPSLCKE